MLDQKFKTDTLLSYFSQGTMIGCGFLFMVLITRYAGVGTYGAFTVLVALSRTMSNLLTFRTNEAVIAFYKKGIASNDTEKCRFALLAGVSVDLSIGIMLMFIIYVFANIIAVELIKDPASAKIVKLYSATILIQMIRSTPVAFLHATERFKTTNLLQMLEHLLRVGGIWVIVATGGILELENVIIVVIIAVIFATIFTTLPMITQIIKFLKIGKSKTNSLLIREYGIFSGKTFISSALKAGNQNVDTLILGYLTNTNVVGIYGLFKQFAFPIHYISSPFTVQLYPRFVNAICKDRPDEMRSIITSINRRLIKIYTLIAVIIFILFAYYTHCLDIRITITYYVSFLLFIIATSILGGLWWARPFSNSVDPWISVKGNIIATSFMLIFIYPLTLFYGILGTTIVMMVLAFVQKLYWRSQLNRQLPMSEY